MKYNLIVAEPGKEPVPYELKAERIGLGRGPENQISIPSEFVSHTHLEFHSLGDDVELEDLGSKNGTRVNGQPVQGRLKLRDGDRILIGECVAAHFLLLPDDAEPVEAATKGDATAHKAAATYTSLDKKIQDLESDIVSKQSEADALAGKIDELRQQFDSRRAEFAELERSVAGLKDQLESKREAAGDHASQEDAAEIAAIEKDILKQTQKITVLKSDLDKREAEISQLQATPQPPSDKSTPSPAPATESEAEAEAKPASPPAPAPPATPAPATLPKPPAAPVPAPPSASAPAPTPAAVPTPPAVPTAKLVSPPTPAADAAAPTPIPAPTPRTGTAIPRPPEAGAAKPPTIPTVKLAKPDSEAAKKPLPIPKKPPQ